MTIDLPVHVDLLETDARLAWRIVDADGVVIPWGTVVAALNATASAPDLTALREAARATLDWLGPVEKSPPLLPGYGLSEEARLVAERNVLRAMLAAALNLNILKDGTP